MLSAPVCSYFHAEALKKSAKSRSLFGAIISKDHLLPETMASATTLFEVPAGDVAVTVRLINPVNFGPAIISRFMVPPVPGFEKKKPGPVLTFLLEHPSGKKLLFDLGIRKDFQNYAPTIANYIPTTKYNIEVTQNVVDILEENGIPGSSIDGVIWRCVNYIRI
jgi:hypothetical protein